MENSTTKSNLKIRKLIILILIFILTFITLLIIYNRIANKDAIFTKGIDLRYRIYTKDGWSKWYKNGQIAGEKNKKILAIEAKISSDAKGHIYYNTYGTNNTFEDNDDYDGVTSGNKKDNIYGIKLGITDELYQKYKIYYRTYNKIDGWLDYASINEISGNNEVNIEKIQIKIIDMNQMINDNTKNPSKGFEKGV